MSHVRLEPDPKLVVRLLPNRRIHEFHVNRRISDEKLRKLESDVDAVWLEEHKSVAKETIKKALDFYQIVGVESVSLDTYCVCVIIYPAFDWDDIQPQVIDIIKEILEWEDCDVDVVESWD